MNLIGWNVLPDDCSVEIAFEEGPSWLKALALTPFLDRFAYPTAVKRGLGFLWCTTLNEEERSELTPFPCDCLYSQGPPKGYEKIRS